MVPPSSRGRGKTRERVLEFVRQAIEQGGSPTVREVQEALGFSAVESARKHLENLVREGALLKETGRARGYRLPSDQQSAMLFVPLVGRVQAGALQAAIEHHDGHIPIEARRPLPNKSSKLFALRVRGESMVNAGILEGDIVIVRKQPHAESGDIVVAMVRGDATVKRLQLFRDRVELWPENPAFEPIVVRPPEDAEILGKVVEVRRYLDGHRSLPSPRRAP